MELFSGIVFTLLFIWFYLVIDIEFYGLGSRIDKIKSMHFNLTPIALGVIYYCLKT